MAFGCSNQEATPLRTGDDPVLRRASQNQSRDMWGHRAAGALARRGSESRSGMEHTRQRRKIDQISPFSQTSGGGQVELSSQAEKCGGNVDAAWAAEGSSF